MERKSQESSWTGLVPRKRLGPYEIATEDSTQILFRTIAKAQSIGRRRPPLEKGTFSFPSDYQAVPSSVLQNACSSRVPIVHTTDLEFCTLAFDLVHGCKKNKDLEIRIQNKEQNFDTYAIHCSPKCDEWANPKYQHDQSSKLVPNHIDAKSRARGSPQNRVRLLW